MGKVCYFFIDAGSCENIISIEAVQKLNLKIEKHLAQYKMAWLKKGSKVTVSLYALVSFSIGSKYKDCVWSNIIAMDTFHLLLWRP